jgi:hypothetical protein
MLIVSFYHFNDYFMHNVIIREEWVRDYYEIFCPNHHNLIYASACAAADLVHTWKLNAREFYTFEDIMLTEYNILPFTHSLPRIKCKINKNEKHKKMYIQHELVL